MYDEDDWHVRTMDKIIDSVSQIAINSHNRPAPSATVHFCGGVSSTFRIRIFRKTTFTVSWYRPADQSRGRNPHPEPTVLTLEEVPATNQMKIMMNKATDLYGEVGDYYTNLESYMPHYSTVGG